MQCDGRPCRTAKRFRAVLGTSRRLEELPEASQYALLGEAIELDHR